jgi:hypothetical protein
VSIHDRHGDDLCVEELVGALHEHAAGMFADTAAADLIARHGVWLPRPEFRPYVHIGHCHATGIRVAYIRWRAAVAALTRGQLSGSTSESAILHIAAGLGANTPIRLREVLGSLDHRNIGLVTDAITLANGT